MLSTLTLALALVSQCAGGSCTARSYAPAYGAYVPHTTAQPALEPRSFRWQLTDSAGQTWTHNDPVWLQQYVAQRNAAAHAATLPRYYFPAASRCAGGACR
jgi:cysteine synthase